MQVNVVVDVVIGLVVLFWIVATSASFVVEAFSSFLNLRGKALELFVREMLLGSDAIAELRGKLSWFPRATGSDRPDGVAQGHLGAQANVNAEHALLDIGDHPLIRRLAKPAAIIGGKDTPPTYIPSDLFVKAVIDRIRQVYSGLLVAGEIVEAVRVHLPEVVPATAGQWLRVPMPQTPTQALQAMLSAIVQLPAACQRIDQAVLNLPADFPLAATFKEIAAQLRAGAAPAQIAALIAAKGPEIGALLACRTLSLADLQAIVASGRLPAPLAAALKPLLDVANHDLEAFRTALAGWFDSVMDRASGWFRRYTQWMLFGAALVIAFALNLDAIYIGQRLVVDRDARDAAVRLGQTVLTHGDDAGKLPQMYLFKERFKDGGWAERLQLAVQPLDKLQVADALARQVQPLLLNSGRYLEPTLALQMAAVQVSVRCKAPADCQPAELSQAWKDQSTSVIALTAGLCRVALAEPQRSRADRDWAARSSDAELLADAERPTPAKRCKTQADLVPRETSNPEAEMGKLWPQPRLTWDIGLANAAWKVRVAAAGGPGDAAQVVKDFRDAMFAGVAAARLQLIAGDDVLDRLPYVGSPSRTWALWSHPGSRWFTWLLSIAGWLITAFMASLGAPMWFDLLNKLINRRITGPKPVSAPAPEA